MQSTAKDVTAYLKEVPAERRETLARLRDLCRKHLTGFEESMEYGLPGYKRDGVVEVGFASQKNFIALYILRTDRDGGAPRPAQGDQRGQGLYPLLETGEGGFHSCGEHVARYAGV